MLGLRIWFHNNDMCMVVFLEQERSILLQSGLNLLPTAGGCNAFSVALAKTPSVRWKAQSSWPFRSYIWTRTALSKGRQLRSHHRKQATNLLVKLFIISVYMRTLDTLWSLLPFFPSRKFNFFSIQFTKSLQTDRLCCHEYSPMKCLKNIRPFVKEGPLRYIGSKFLRKINFVHHGKVNSLFTKGECEYSIFFAVGKVMEIL